MQQREEVSEGYQRYICYQLASAFNKLTNETHRIVYDIVIQKLTQILKFDDKLFIKIYEKILNYNQESVEDFPITKNTKLITSSFLNYFIEKNLLINQQVGQEYQANCKIYQSSGLTQQINSWINSIQRVLEGNLEEDFYPYKNTLMEIYTKMLLYNHLYSIQGIKKLVNMVRYFMKKKRSKLSLNLISKLLQNSKLIKITKIKPKSKEKENYKKKFKSQQILQEILNLLLEDLDNHFNKLEQNSLSDNRPADNHEFMQKQTIECFQQITQIISQMETRNYMDHLCQDIRFTSILNSYLMTQFKYIINKEYRYVAKNCLLIITQKIAVFIAQSPEKSPNQYIIQLMIKLGEFIWNQHIQKEPLDQLFINESVTNFILMIIQLGRRGAILEDGQRISEFKGNYSYLIRKFMSPIFQSFILILKKSFLDMEQGKAFVNSIKQLAYQMKMPQKQYFDSFSHIQVLQQPKLYAYTRIINKLSKNFTQLNTKIKRIVEQCIQGEVFSEYFIQQKFKNDNQIQEVLKDIQTKRIYPLEKYNLIMGLSLNCVFSNILGRYQQWLYFMINLPSKVRQTLLSKDSSHNQQSSMLRSLLLLNFRLYMDDILIQQQSDCEVIYQIVKILTDTERIKQKSDIQVLLYIDIVEYYYNHFNFSYVSQKDIIARILKTSPNKFIISLQLQLLQKYNSNVEIRYVSSFVCLVIDNIKQGVMSREIIYSTVIRIFNLLHLYFINRKQHYNQQSTQIYQINKVISELMVQIKLFLIKPRLIICRQFSQLLNSIIKTTNWRQNFLFVVTRKYLQFLYIMYQTFKDKIEGYEGIYLNFQQMLFKSTLQIAQQIDLTSFQHTRIEECEFDRRNNVCTDLRSQIKLYFVYTFLSILCSQKYSTYFQNYHYEDQPIKKLVKNSISYLLQYKCKNIEYSVVFILIIHEIIDKVPQLLDQIDIQMILKLVMRQTNRRNKLLITDSAYLYRGKIYILFILLMKTRIHCVLNYFDKMIYSEIDQNTLSGKNQAKIKQLLVQVFCNARNYAPHYDILTLMTNLMNLLQFLVQSSNQKGIQGGLKLHSKYIHLYIKLLLQAAQRIYVYQTLRADQQIEALNSQQFTQMWDQHTKIQLKSLYKLVLWVTKQKIDLQKNQKNTNEMLCDFVRFYKKLKGLKQKWLNGVQNRLISKKTIKNIMKIIETYEKCNKNMKRKIYTIANKND